MASRKSPPRLGRELNFFENLSTHEYLDIVSLSRTLDGVVAWDMGNRQIDELGTENVFSAFWWGDAFPTLQMTPVLGRGFLREETTNGERVAVISHRLWQDGFGSDPDVVGSTIHINSDPFTLVGVMPPGALIYGTDLWYPMGVAPERLPRGRRQFQIMARLAPGGTLEAVNAELETIARQTELAHGEEFREYADWQLVAMTWNDVSARQLKLAAQVLMAAVVFVLLLVCANVASLLLARATGRRREFAVRTALGASRIRLVRQLLIESVAFSLTGGVLGMLLAAAGVRGFLAITSISPIGLPGTVGIDGRVLIFATGISILCGLVFGMVPAVHVARTDVQNALRADAPTATAAGSRLRWQRAFVAVEVALAVVLLTGGGLLVRSFLQLQTVSPGFDTRQLLSMRLTLPPAKYPGRAAGVFFTELVDRPRAAARCGGSRGRVAVPAHRVLANPVHGAGSRARTGRTVAERAADGGEPRILRGARSPAAPRTALHRSRPRGRARRGHHQRCGGPTLLRGGRCRGAALHDREHRQPRSRGRGDRRRRVGAQPRAGGAGRARNLGKPRPAAGTVESTVCGHPDRGVAARAAAGRPGRRSRRWIRSSRSTPSRRSTMRSRRSRRRAASPLCSLLAL